MRQVLLFVCAFICIQHVVAQDWFDKAAYLKQDGDYKTALGIMMQYKTEWTAQHKNEVGLLYEMLDDVSNAIKYYKLASDAGSAFASFNLGRLYDRRYGKHPGIMSSDEEAKKYYMKSIYSNYSNDERLGGCWSAVNLFIVYKDENKIEECKPILEYVVRNKINLCEIPYLMALYLYSGKRESVYYYRISAENGYNRAQYEYAKLLQEGKLIEKDLKEAVKWYRKAASNGSWEAENELGGCYEDLYLKTLDERYLNSCLKYYYKIYTEDNASGLPRIVRLTGKNPLEEIYNKGLANAEKYKSYTDWLSKEVKPIAIESDVDINIPQTGTKTNSFALIVANENYKYEHYVPYAENDGETLKKYFENTIGVPSDNIHLVADASLNEMKKEIEWLIEHGKDSEKLYFYYSGHGIPAMDLSTSYLLPCDGYAKDPETGLDIKWLYSKLETTNIPCYVFLDACFSGSGRDQQVLVESRGVAIKTKSIMPQSKTVVFSACQGTEMAYPLDEQKHGLFTYYLLKMMQTTKGKMTLGCLYDYIQQNVSQRARSEKIGIQTPVLVPSLTMKETWRNMKL